MEKYTEITGNLITLTKEGKFKVITHGCNCFCTMKAGIAPQMAEAFGCNEFPSENERLKGNINKLGTIDYKKIELAGENKNVYVVNSYTQFNFKTVDNVKPFDYIAFALCMKKINSIFKGLSVGLPQIGAGLAGGDWNIIKDIIQRELKDCFVTIVIYDLKNEKL